MKILIIDTNVLFAFFSSKRVVEIFKKLYLSGVKLIVPQFVMEELENLREKIIKRGITKEEYINSFQLLKLLIEVVPKSKYEIFLDEALKISPHKKDAPLFALSLAFNKAPIWSREPRLKRQKTIQVLSDIEVEALIRSYSS
jgi:predicted nucleic acid-binding protein